MAIELKLWQFSLPGIDERLYLFSLRKGEDYLRSQFACQDHGGLSFEIYNDLYTKGEIKRITSLDQVPEEDHHWTPYHSWEIDNNAVTLDVIEFLNPPEDYQ